MKLFLKVQYVHSQIIFLQKIAISEDFSTPPNGAWNGILSYELGNIIMGAYSYRKQEDKASESMDCFVSTQEDTIRRFGLLSSCEVQTVQCPIHPLLTPSPCTLLISTSYKSVCLMLNHVLSVCSVLILQQLLWLNNKAWDLIDSQMSPTMEQNYRTDIKGCCYLPMCKPHK